MSQLGITAINVFVEIEGKQCMAPISAESADMFLGMLPAFQRGGSQVNLVTLPESVTAKLIETRAAILDHLNAAQKGKQ